MDHYLVSGGAGFVGSHLAKRLSLTGENVVVIDDLSTGSTENVPDRVEFVNIDISKANEFENIPKHNYRAFLHLAGQSSGERSFDDPSRDFEINALGTLNCLEYCRKKKIPRFLNASSMSVYGDRPDSEVKEDDPLDPISFYGNSKITAENICTFFDRHHGIKTTSFRLFNVYGPGQNLTNMKQGMISIYLAYLLFENKIDIKGSLDRFRDFIYIDDLVDAWIAAMDAPQAYGQVFNLGTGTKTTVRDLVDIMLSTSGRSNIPINQLPETLGDIRGVYANIEKICTALSWTPKYSLQEGFKKMFDHESASIHQRGDL